MTAHGFAGSYLWFDGGPWRLAMPAAAVARVDTLEDALAQPEPGSPVADLLARWGWPPLDRSVVRLSDGKRRRTLWLGRSHGLAEVAAAWRLPPGLCPAGSPVLAIGCDPHDEPGLILDPCGILELP